MRTFQSKIIISILVIIFVIITGSYLVIQDIQKGFIEGEFRDKGNLLARNLASEITTPVLVNDLVDIRNSFENVRDNFQDIEYVYATDSEGIVLVHTFESGFPDALMEANNSARSDAEKILNTERGVIHEFKAPLFKNIGYVYVGLSENRVKTQVNEASRTLLILAIFTMVFGGVSSILIGKKLTDPILKLTEGAKRIDQGILDHRIDIRSGDEFAELARTFNEMALSLDQKIKDITSSKEQKENAEKYLETLFNNIQDGIIVLNADHEIIKANTSFLKVTGLTEEQLIGKTCHEMVFGMKASREEIDKCPVSSSLETGRSKIIEHEAVLDGDKRIFEISTSSFIEKKGVTNIIMVLRDVTRRKALEKEITERNKELIVLNEISRDINEIFDLDEILLRTLENLLKLSGMDRGCLYLIDERTGDMSLKAHMGEEVSTEIIRFLAKESEVLIIEDINEIPGVKFEEDKYVSLVGIPLRSKDKVLGLITLGNREHHRFSKRDGELFAAVGNQVGVAVENVLFYNNIQDLNKFNIDILNNINIALHVVDRDMNVLAVNNELLKLGRGKLKKEHIINMNLYEVFPFLKERHIDKEYDLVFRTGEIFQTEEKTEYHGELIYTSTSKIPIKGEDGTVEKVITLMSDITEKKILEEDLKNSYEELKLTYSKLKELYRIKDSFLSNVSHELRTPLTSIIGFTELLLEDDINEEQRHRLNIILRNSKRLHYSINGLLDTTVIESGNLQLEWETFSLFEIVSQVVEDMNITASIKNIPIKIVLSKKLMVNGDKERLRQVISNIVDNALKFTISGEIKIIADKEEEDVHLKISDTGVGIPEKELDLIFSRFYQLDESRRIEHGGLGIGLWISKNIINAHGGSIWAESKNRGSTFHVLIPRRRK